VQFRIETYFLDLINTLIRKRYEDRAEVGRLIGKYITILAENQRNLYL